MKARRHVEITASVGAIITKARTAWKALCEWGTIWLKSDAVDPKKEAIPTPDDVVNDPKPEVHSAAIILDSSKGRTIVSGKRKILVQCYGTPDSAEDLTDDTASVVIQSRHQDTRLVGNRLALLKAESKFATVEGSLGVVLKGPKLLSNASIFDINQQFTIKSGVVNTIKIRAAGISATARLAGPTPVAWVSKQLKPGYHRHGNHVSEIEGSDTAELATSGDIQLRSEYDQIKLKYKSGFDSDNSEEGPTWKFSIEDYDWTYNDSYGLTNGKKEVRIQPLAQQRIVFDTSLNSYYTDWDFAAIDKLKEAPRTDQVFPYPGRSINHEVHIGTAEPLHAPSEKLHNEFSPNIKTALTRAPMTIKFLKK